MSTRERLPARTFDPFLEGEAPPGPPTMRRPASPPASPEPSPKRKPRSKAKRKPKSKRRR